MVSSVTEAEFGALFVNAKEGTVTRTTLSEMGHIQDATDLTTDNTTPPQMELSTPPYSKNDPNLWICGSTGSKTE
jgi:hypothetical protein